MTAPGRVMVSGIAVARLASMLVRCVDQVTERGVPVQRLAHIRARISYVRAVDADRLVAPRAGDLHSPVRVKPEVSHLLVYRAYRQGGLGHGSVLRWVAMRWLAERLPGPPRQPHMQLLSRGRALGCRKTASPHQGEQWHEPGRPHHARHSRGVACRYRCWRRRSYSPQSQPRARSRRAGMAQAWDTGLSSSSRPPGALYRASSSAHTSGHALLSLARLRLSACRMRTITKA